MLIYQLLLGLTASVCLYGIYLWKKLRGDGTFDLLLGSAMVYLLVHATYVLVVRTFFGQLPYLNLAAPFILSYGPLLFFLLQLLRKGRLERATLIAHLSIPILFWLGFLIFVFLDPLDPLHQGYRRTLSLAALLSFGGYTIYGIFGSLQMPGTKKMLIPGLLWFLLLMACMLIVSYAHYRYKGAYLGRSTLAPMLLNSMVYTVMLGVSLLLVRQVQRPINLEKPLEPSFESTQERQNYQKSSLSTAAMIELEEKINKAMLRDRIFLDSGLSLASLSNRLKVPPHYLTQTMNMHMGKNFFEIVNALRIQTACELLVQQPPLSLEQIATQSGFNALPAFSRNFKKITGSTPMAYRTKSWLELQQKLPSA